MNFEKKLRQVRKFKKEIAVEYNVSETSIVWVGFNNFVVQKNEKQIKIGNENN